MSKKKNHPLVGKVGWCDKDTLGLNTGHYVFIRRVYGNKCSVNTFTSIKTRDGHYDTRKLKSVERGSVYPIPNKDTTLPRFGGVHNKVITNIPIDKIQDVGRYSLKRRHHHYIQKYVKK